MFFFFNEPTTTVIYTLSLHDALPIYVVAPLGKGEVGGDGRLGRDVCDEGGIGCEHAPRDGQRPGDVAQPLAILRVQQEGRHTHRPSCRTRRITTGWATSPGRGPARGAGSQPSPPSPHHATPCRPA